ncbi:MAG: YwaF family protein [Erysipelotrichaceae bacterium]|nr:YwaF family protein [Erysipelotrichaceae bacterium]
MKPKKYIVQALYAFTIYFLLSEILKQFLLFQENGSYDWWHFPFQLCSMPLYDLPLYLYFKKRNHKLAKAIATFMTVYGTLGGFIVFLDTSGMHFTNPFLTFNSFLWHIMMAVLSVFLYRNVETDFSWKGYRNVCGIYLVHAVIATILNVTLRYYGTIDMFYISPYEKMNQIVFKEIGETIGNSNVIILYILVSLLGGGIVMYLYHFLEREKEC